MKAFLFSSLVTKSDGEGHPGTGRDEAVSQPREFCGSGTHSLFKHTTYSRR